jgi:hypothetical protein
MGTQQSSERREAHYRRIFAELQENRYRDAVSNQSLAAVWNFPDYQPFPDHKHRSLHGKWFIVRNNWALRSGLMQSAGYPLIEEHEKPGSNGCSCFFEYTASPRCLPDAMITPAGRIWISKVRMANPEVAPPSQTKTSWLSQWTARLACR